MVLLCGLLALSNVDSVSVEEFCVDIKVSESTGLKVDSVKSGSGDGKIVKDLQDFRGGNKLKTVVVDGGDIQEYGVRVVAYAASGITLSILSCLCCCCISSCRLIGKCFKPTREYHRKDKIIVLGIYSFFALGCIICSILGSVTLGKFVNSSSDIVCSMEGLRTETEGFFDEMMVPVNGLRSIASTNIDKISANLNNVGKIGVQNDKIIASTDEFGKNVSKISVHPNVTCSFCLQTGKDINATTEKLRETVKPQITQMESTASTLNLQVVAMKSIIVGIVDGAKLSVNSLVDVVTVSFKSMITTIMVSADPIRQQIVAVGSAFFALSFVVVIFTFLGVAVEVCGAYTNCSKNKCIDQLDDQVGRMLVWVAWEVTFVFAVILFLLAGLMLPIGVIVSDACVVFDEFPDNVGLYLAPMISSGQGVTVLEGCFQNKSLFVLLNMTSAFAFKDQLSFGASDTFNSSQTFNFGEFGKMRKTVHSLTYKNFSAPGSDIDQDIATAEGYGQTAQANELKTIRSNGNKTVIWMKEDVDAIQLSIDELKNLTGALQAGLNKTKPYVNEILDQVDVILHGGKCGFIAPQYEKFTGIMCGDFLESILELSLYCFLCGLFGIFMICGNLNIQRRFGAHGEYDPHEQDDLLGLVRGMTFKKIPTDSDMVVPMEAAENVTNSEAVTESAYVVEGQAMDGPVNNNDVVEVPIQEEDNGEFL